MTDDAFFGLAGLLWLICFVQSVRAGHGRRWWWLILAPLAFALGFAVLMVAMATLAQDGPGGELSWLGFAPYFALPFLPVLPVGFALGWLVSVLRRKGGREA
jgi:hypothetical protein